MWRNDKLKRIEELRNGFDKSIWRITNNNLSKFHPSNGACQTVSREEKNVGSRLNRTPRLIASNSCMCLLRARDRCANGAHRCKRKRRKVHVRSRRSRAEYCRVVPPGLLVRGATEKRRDASLVPHSLFQPLDGVSRPALSNRPARFTVSLALPRHASPRRVVSRRAVSTPFLAATLLDGSCISILDHPVTPRIVTCMHGPFDAPLPGKWQPTYHWINGTDT